MLHSSSIYFSLSWQEQWVFYLFVTSLFLRFVSLPLSLYPSIPHTHLGVLPKIAEIIQAYKLGMYGADYVWILHEIAGEPWWHKASQECSQKQLQEVSENLLIVSSHNSIVSNEISYSGLVSLSLAHSLSLSLCVSVYDSESIHIYSYRCINASTSTLTLPFNNPIEINAPFSVRLFHLT